jgi:predicted transcriptional regulator
MKYTAAEYKQALKVVAAYEKQNKPLWKTDFDEYIKEAHKGLELVLSNDKFIAEEEKVYPFLDIRKSIQRGFDVFWGTEEGFKNKAKSKHNEINWVLTYRKTIAFNKVYKNRFESGNIDKLSHANSGKNLNKLMYGDKS